MATRDVFSEEELSRLRGFPAEINRMELIRYFTLTAADAEFVGKFRGRGSVLGSELAALTVDQLIEHPNGLVLTLPRSKTNQRGEQAELVVLPRAGHPARCPVTALRTWLDAAAITAGPALCPVSKGNRALPRRLHPESINDLVQAAVHRVAPKATGYSAHSLRAGFVTFAHLRGATDHAIAHQTRHRSLATVGTYVRIESAWTDNAATMLGL